MNPNVYSKQFRVGKKIQDDLKQLQQEALKKKKVSCLQFRFAMLEQAIFNPPQLQINIRETRVIHTLYNAVINRATCASVWNH